MIKKSIALILLSTSFLGAFPKSSDAEPVLIECFTDECVLTFDVNAGWTQKAVITGPNGYSVSVVGQGERVRVFKDFVECGVYEVSLYHNDGYGWHPSDVETHESAAFADDGGGRSPDFNDAIVTLR